MQNSLVNIKINLGLDVNSTSKCQEDISDLNKINTALTLQLLDSRAETFKRLQLHCIVVKGFFLSK